MDGKDGLVDTIQDVAEIASEEKTSSQSKAARMAHELIEFIIKCFRCKNKEKTPIMLHRESLTLQKPANAWQVIGVCSTCQKPVKSFITNKRAEELKAQGIPVSKWEPKEKKKRKARDEVVGEESGEVTAKKAKESKD